jgi:hypothetical protein
MEGAVAPGARTLLTGVLRTVKMTIYSDALETALIGTLVALD